MALFSRRTGIAGITAGALLCLICGLPVIAALLGLGGISLGTIQSNLPVELKFAVFGGILLVLAVVFAILAKRCVRTASDSNR